MPPCTPACGSMQHRGWITSPDVVAVGGWERGGYGFTGASGAGYFGTQVSGIETITLLGQPVRYYTSSHERSHIMMAVGMAGDPAPHEAVLVWEGAVGGFYEFDRRTGGLVSHPVMSEPGGRYAFLYALGDPTFPDSAHYPRVNDAGRLMALAAFGDPDPAPEVTEAVQAILELPSVYPGVTHVDGTARVHVVHSEASPGFHALLTAFRRCTDVGVLCNTSLNYPGCGFLNRMSDLLAYCEDRGVHHAVIDGVHLTDG